jgi:hypothetical protein
MRKPGTESLTGKEFFGRERFAFPFAHVSAERTKPARFDRRLSKLEPHAEAVRHATDDTPANRGVVVNFDRHCT